MPGDDWQKFANLRCLYGWMFATPGKKLLFMGSELAPWDEWNHDEGLPWHLTQGQEHEGVLQWVAALNHLYREVPALHELDNNGAGFGWIDANDRERSIITALRSSSDGDLVVAAFNATPVPRHDVVTGVPEAGDWEVLMCSDDKAYGGSGYGRPDTYETNPVGHCGFEQSISLTLPPLSLTFLRYGHK